MAVTITPADVSGGSLPHEFSRLFVIGVRPGDGRDELTSLLANHAVTDGLAFLPPGHTDQQPRRHVHQRRRTCPTRRCRRRTSIVSGRPVRSWRRRSVSRSTCGRRSREPSTPSAASHRRSSARRGPPRSATSPTSCSIRSSTTQRWTQARDHCPELPPTARAARHAPRRPPAARRAARDALPRREAPMASATASGGSSTALRPALATLPSSRSRGSPPAVTSNRRCSPSSSGRRGRCASGTAGCSGRLLGHAAGGLGTTQQLQSAVRSIALPRRPRRRRAAASRAVRRAARAALPARPDGR